MPWASGLRMPGHPSCTDGLLVSALPARDFPTATTRMGSAGGVYAGTVGTNALPSTSSSPLQQPPPQPSSAPSSDHPPINAAAAAAATPPRSSRKRSRASRRAPTTVLTTDTSNFRAMVQEFTGIPAPPFASSSFPRSRFDLFHAATSPAMMRSSGVLDAAPHSLLRPFAQKVPVPSFGPIARGSSSSAAPPTMSTAIATTTTSRTNADGSITGAYATNTSAANVSSTAISTATTSVSNTYQLTSDTALGDQHRNLLNMFNFQSLQPSPTTKYNLLDAAVLGGAKVHQESRPGMPSSADYATGGGLRHGRSLAAPAEGMPSSRGGGSGAGDDLLQWVEGSGGSEGGDEGQLFRPAGGSCGKSRRGSDCKLNCAGSAAVEGGQENATARGEGMLDSWTYSSD